MTAIRVHHAGALTTVQDAGRPGLRRFGIPPSGAMDQFSYAIANALVDNEPGAAALEVTLTGLEVEATVAITVAITGADLGAHVNGGAAPMWTSLPLRRGDRVTFRACRSGCRAYLAVRGGLQAPEFLGSRSTFVLGRMGQPVQAGDELAIGEYAAAAPLRARQLSAHFQPVFASPQRIRVVLGPQLDRFTKSGIDTFLQSEYRLSPRSDRQGLRTDGPVVETVSGSDIISDPTPLGTVQIPGDGRPIILHRDGQVTGGYAKIAVVASVDLDRLGRMAPGDAMTFEPVTPGQARELAAQARERLRMIVEALRQA